MHQPAGSGLASDSQSQIKTAGTAKIAYESAIKVIAEGDFLVSQFMPMPNSLKGLATGIGSLPYNNAEQAVDLIFNYVPQIPFWPQLPKRDVREGMIAQFSENFPCLKLGPNGLYFDQNNQEKELEAFYEQIIANNLDYFKIDADFAFGLHKFYQRLGKIELKNIEFIKCHITGPFTFAASVNDHKGIALLHNPVFMQVVLKCLLMKALWQINLFRHFGKKIIIFLDEPYLSCFGSAYTPIDRKTIIEGLSEITTGLKSDNVFVGVHCCGNTDWSILMDISSIDIISFDAYTFLNRLFLYADNLEQFLKRDGILCWGIVPTQKLLPQQTPLLLIDKIKEGINILVKKGLDKDRLLDRLCLSPACGLGTVDIETAENIFKLLSETAQLLSFSN